MSTYTRASPPRRQRKKDDELKGAAEGRGRRRLAEVAAGVKRPASLLAMEEGWKEVAAGAGRRWRRRSGGKGGDSGDESDGSSGGGGVELSLRLRTGDSTSVPPPAPMAVAEEERHQAAAAAEAEGRRNMTIFYNGRVCAVDVTEVQVIHQLMPH